MSDEIKCCHEPPRDLSVRDEVDGIVAGGASWAGIPGTLWIRVGQNDVAQQPGIRVVRLELDGLLDLYVGHGKAITQN